MSDWQSGWPDKNDVGRLVDIEIGGRVITGPLYISDWEPEIEGATAPIWKVSHVSDGPNGYGATTNELYSFADADRWRWHDEMRRFKEVSVVTTWKQHCELRELLGKEKIHNCSLDAWGKFNEADRRVLISNLEAQLREGNYEPTHGEVW